MFLVRILAVPANRDLNESHQNSVNICVLWSLTEHIQSIHRNLGARAMADGYPFALENEAETETCMPDDEFLVFQAELIAMDRSFKDALLKTLELPKSQQELLRSALRVSASGLKKAAATPNVAGKNKMPDADASASGAMPDAFAPRPYRVVSIPEGFPATFYERLQQLGHYAEQGGREELQDEELSQHIKHTYMPEFEGSGRLWFYILKCSYCRRIAVSSMGVGDGPTSWAINHGWKRPTGGTKKWQRCRCPKCIELP